MTGHLTVKWAKLPQKEHFSMAPRHVADRRQHIGLIIVSLIAALFTPIALPSHSVAPTTATSISPVSGNATGGTLVQISGTGLSISNVSQVADVFLETVHGNRFSMSFTVVSDAQVTASTPVMAVASQSPGLGAVYVIFIDNSVSSFSFALTPTVTGVSPSSGTAAGGASITISGTAFIDDISGSNIVKILVGETEILPANFTIVNSTTITASIPIRQTVSKTVGSKRVVIYYSEQVSSSDDVRYSFVPVRDASKDRAVGSGASGRVILGELASRTDRKAVFRTTTEPFIVTGTDSLTRQSYEYQTNFGYSAGAGAYAREGHQPGYHKKNGGTTNTTPPSLTTTITASVAGQYYASGAFYSTYASGRYTLSYDAVHMRSSGGCGENLNSFDSGDGQGTVTTYCTGFGPEIYSEAFYGRAGQSLAFNWLPIGETDDAAVYAWLVAVDNETTIPYTDVNSHTLLAHAVTYRNNRMDWQTSTGQIPVDGLYRFRFTNGTYDGTGGFAIGSSFFISSVYEAGTSQEISFGPISDQIGAGNATFTATATATNGGEVTVTSKTTSICEVTTSYSAPNTTVTITKKSTGTCQLLATKGAEGEYAPASDKLVAFEIRASATNASAPIITNVSPGNQQLTIDFTRPSRDGGFEIINYQYSTDNGSTWVSVSPATTSLRMVIYTRTSDGLSLSNGVTYSIKVRALTNTDSAVALGTASNTGTGTPNAPAVPILAYSPATLTRNQGSVTTILAPDNSGGAVTTYAVSSGTLPPGMTLNTTTGIISGNPSSQGAYTFTITGTNSSGTSNPATMSVTVNPPAANPPDISWDIGASSVYSLEVGESLTTPAPTNSNTVDSALFSISPALPTGLSINTSTGVVSGSPDEPIAATLFTITATNGAGSSTVSLTITVTLTAPNISPNSGVTYYVGSAVSQAAPTNTGGRIASWTISPSLPGGLTLNTATGTITGTPTSESSATAYVLSASNATGTSSITLTITVLTPASGATETPKPGSYSGPNPTLFVPRVLEENKAQTVRVIGERLDQVTGMSHLGVTLTFTIISSREIEVRVPALPIGIKQIRFDYRPGGIVTYMNALDVRPATLTVKPTSSPITEPTNPVTLSPVRKAIVWGFIPGLTRLDSSGVRNLSAVSARLASAKEISCIGFTMGPTVLARDIQLSYDRALTVCNRLKMVIPGVKVVRLEGRQDTRKGDRIRRVEIEWRN